MKNFINKNLVVVSMFIFVLVPVFVNAADPTSAQDTANQANPFFCQSLSTSSNLGDIINFATCLLTKGIVPLLVALATAAFVWGIIQYFLNPDNEEKKKKANSYMLWGIIALFVIITMWGLVGILSATFFGQGPILIPKLSQ